MTRRFARVLLVVLAATLPGAAQAEAHEPKPDKSIVYKTVGDIELRLHVFLPPGWSEGDQRPAVVFFFGGGWVSGTPKQFFPQCHYLAGRGMVAMSADYRVKNRHGTSPRECVQDGCSAVRWIRQHAGELGIDPARLAAGGGSAGGHVAAATGTVTNITEPGEETTTSCRPNALVLFNPVFDNGPNGWGHKAVRDYWREISPRHNIDSQTPPAIVLLGTADRLIPVATAEGFCKAMHDAGGRCELKLYADQPHGFFNNPPMQQQTLADVDQFLQSLGWLAAPAAVP
jgi:acetyl esterase/lipase